MFENCKAEQKPDRLDKKIIKNSERDIPEKRAEIVKLKRELEPLKKTRRTKKSTIRFTRTSRSLWVSNTRN